MKKFLLRFLLWCFIAFVIALSMDYMVSTGLRKTNLRKFSVWNDIYKGGLTPNLVVIGNSQAWNGYNTYMLDSLLHLDSYNLAIDGHPIDYQILRYNTYKRFNSIPKVMLINASFMGTFQITADGRYEREQFFPYFFDDSLISVVAEKKEISIFDRYLPLARYFGYRDIVEDGIVAFFGEPRPFWKSRYYDDGMHKGYRGEQLAWDRGVVSKDVVMDAKINDEAFYILKDFTKQMCEDGIRVVFVKYPVYFPAREKFVNICQSDSAFSVISKEFNVQILDYCFSDMSKDSTNYYDPSHLNKKGSEVFTMQLCHDLDSLGVLRD